MVMMTVAVRMVVIGAIAADAADMVMMTGLRRADLGGVADDLRAIFAELAIHRRIADTDLLDALGKAVEHERPIPHIRRLYEPHCPKPCAATSDLLLDTLPH